MYHLINKKIAPRFNQLSLRERVMIFLAVLACFVGGLYLWVIEPCVMQSMARSDTLKRIQREQDLVHLQIEQVSSPQRNALEQQNNNDMALLTQRLAALNKQLRIPLAQFTDANAMPSALYHVLAHGDDAGVNVTSLKSLPVTPFYIAPYAGNTLSDDQEVLIYRHTLELKFTATYDQTYRYLRRLSSLTIPFYWHALTFELVNYPLANVTLQIDTLSTDANLMRQ